MRTPARDLIGLPVTTDLARSRFVAHFDGAIKDVNAKLEKTFEDINAGTRTVEA